METNFSLIPKLWSTIQGQCSESPIKKISNFLQSKCKKCVIDIEKEVLFKFL